ncbi:MAG: AAA family ATPase, partial [Muribaculaceae bacterium]|nr:AAA family ATPase [Muribaculaceae bacterium]
AMRRRGAEQIAPNDIEGTEEHESSVDEILAKLDDFVGIDEIKEEVLDIIHEIQYDRERFGAAPSINSHFVFTGNPGTGKTTIARVFADVLKAMDVLPSGHIVEADRAKLVGQYVGETAIKTNAVIDSAIGGILFIDEAYTLANDVNSNTSFGKEVIDTLLKRLEDDRGKFVCIVAGYPKEMTDFLHSNPGMESRFNRHIKFRDYNAEELELIFKKLIEKNHFKIDPSASSSVKNCFLSLHTTRTKNFGNAREVRKVFEDTKKRQGKRLAQLRANGQYSPEMAFIFTAEDLPLQSHRDINIEDCQRRLESLVGLGNVKQEIRSLASYLTLEKMRSQALGRPYTPPTDHYLFLGNPGTGKTTVARILGEIFYALGISKTTNFIEVDRSSLVASYVGQTAIKTNKLIDNALGGILFIDEAYTLIQGENDSFGQEAVDTLLKRMEDDRGKFICIAAGYSYEMQRFISSNSGLQSRFNKTMHFDDYTQSELEEILKRKISKENFILTPDAQNALTQAVARLFATRSRNFGNAREINNLFQKIKERQSLRIINTLNHTRPSNREILTLKGVDFL